VRERFPYYSLPALGPTQPPLQWVPSLFFPEGKEPGRDADQSPPSRVEVRERVELNLHGMFDGELYNVYEKGIHLSQDKSR
jgi:hypothetical protein